MNDQPSPAKKESLSKPSATARRKAARLMAVQALYQMSVNHKEPLFVVEEYLHLRRNMEVDGETMVEPDTDLFRNIVLGVAERIEDLDGIVAANRPSRGEDVPVVEEPLLKSVFLCGAYELLVRTDIDAPLIISSYVEVAKAFFAGKEPGLVNAVLDSIRKVVRT